MDDRGGGGGGSFVAVRRVSQGLDRSNTCQTSSAEVVAGSAAWLGRGLSCVCVQGSEEESRPSFDLTPAQEDCLMRLQSRLDNAYDSSIPEHQESLRALWKAAFPEEELHGLISEQWKEMGWQGKDPSTDFRGGGFISLENLLYFARNFPKSFQDLLKKQEGDRSMWEYPFAVAGVNITFMLIQMLDLEAVKPRTLVGATFLKFLSDNESAFNLLYCIAFVLMDHQWLAMRASYMDFNAVMKLTRLQMEKELLDENITRLEELPSYAYLRGFQSQQSSLSNSLNFSYGFRISPLKTSQFVPFIIRTSYSSSSSSISKVRSYGGGVEYDKRRETSVTWKAIYKRISLMGNPEKGAIEVLNQLENEGKKFTKWDICRVVKEMRKYGRHRLALEVCELKC
ncbi:hypothetical protein E3N88_19296 [Mikania micrantha]|uniref:ELMO domain-containing protein n=1 Tax=Mikania micrantha TaxID=192012 RepID=A0A5N6NPF3_9ASTR|nr:hypothetical protein E3N88_19296 [Mikania micrantha]